MISFGADSMACFLAHEMVDVLAVRPPHSLRAGYLSAVHSPCS